MTSMSDAYRLAAINSFLTYTRGPFHSAIDAMSEIIENVKHITKLEGLKTIVGRHKKHPKKKRPDSSKLAIDKPIRLSFGKQLNSERNGP